MGRVKVSKIVATLNGAVGEMSPSIESVCRCGSIICGVRVETTVNGGDCIDEYGKINRQSVRFTHWPTSSTSCDAVRTCQLLPAEGWKGDHRRCVIQREIAQTEWDRKELQCTNIRDIPSRVLPQLGKVTTYRREEPEGLPSPTVRHDNVHEGRDAVGIINVGSSQSMSVAETLNLSGWKPSAAPSCSFVLPVAPLLGGDGKLCTMEKPAILFINSLGQVLKISGQARSQAWLWPESHHAMAFTRASRAISGFGLRNCQARPKANPGHIFGLALASVPKPEKHYLILAAIKHVFEQPQCLNYFSLKSERIWLGAGPKFVVSGGAFYGSKFAVRYEV
ncbi:hypothetical protein B0H13DRAFT_1884621 [Mycena leptocephala]|nr:hypothetical protein B0H13DRAFT_1884621 [Mycena leptocephala]